MLKIKRPLDIKALNKKYGFSVNRVIKAWKADKTDQEIASQLGIDLVKISCLRRDIEEEKLYPNKPKTSFFLLE